MGEEQGNDRRQSSGRELIRGLGCFNQFGKRPNPSATGSPLKPDLKQIPSRCFLLCSTLSFLKLRLKFSLFLKTVDGTWLCSVIQSELFHSCNSKLSAVTCALGVRKTYKCGVNIGSRIPLCNRLTAKHLYSEAQSTRSNAMEMFYMFTALWVL